MDIHAGAGLWWGANPWARESVTVTVFPGWVSTSTVEIWVFVPWDLDLELWAADVNVLAPSRHPHHSVGVALLVTVIVRLWVSPAPLPLPSSEP